MVNPAKTKNLSILIATAIAGIVGLFFVGPIPQNVHYHNFADNLSKLDIPNFWNVISNLPFAIFGGMGLWYLMRGGAKQQPATVRTIFAACFFGVFLTCFGSVWYHLNPNNETLLWDRVPMTLVFMPFFSLILYDYIGNAFGKMAFWLLMAVGIGSVLYWYYTETIGAGDLRIYLVVQFYPMIVIPLLLLLNGGVTNYGKQIIWVFLLYVAAKVCESFDEQIHNVLGGIGGHPIKHIFAGFAAYYIFRLMKERKVLCVYS